MRWCVSGSVSLELTLALGVLLLLVFGGFQMAAAGLVSGALQREAEAVARAVAVDPGGGAVACADAVSRVQAAPLASLALRSVPVCGVSVAGGFGSPVVVSLEADVAVQLPFLPLAPVHLLKRAQAVVEAYP